MRIRFLAMYVIFFMVGAVLALVARRRDHRLGSDRTRGLGPKFLSYMGICLAVLAFGWVPSAIRQSVALLLAILMLVELERALEHRHPSPAAARHAWTLALLAASWLAPGAVAITGIVRLLFVETLELRTPGLGPEVLFDRAYCRSRLQVLMGLSGLLLLDPLDPSGAAWCFLWISLATMDGYAQIIGQALGSRVMAPRISPGKTWEGAAGGFVTALVVGQMLGFALPEESAADRLLLSALIAFCGMRGDLLASSSKRVLGIKDFSTLLGPHGGLIDRFDSLLATLPAFAVALLALRGLDLARALAPGW